MLSSNIIAKVAIVTGIIVATIGVVVAQRQKAMRVPSLLRLLRMMLRMTLGKYDDGDDHV